MILCNCKPSKGVKLYNNYIKHKQLPSGKNALLQTVFWRFCPLGTIELVFCVDIQNVLIIFFDFDDVLRIP